MATAVWILLAMAVVAVMIWRLRKANDLLSSILREERAWVDEAEPVKHAQQIVRNRRS